MISDRFLTPGGVGGVHIRLNCLNQLRLADTSVTFLRHFAALKDAQKQIPSGNDNKKSSGKTKTETAGPSERRARPLLEDFCLSRLCAFEE